MDQSIRIIAPETDGIAVCDLHFALIEALYVEAMVLADEARAYFETAHSASQKTTGQKTTGPKNPGPKNLGPNFLDQKMMDLKPATDMSSAEIPPLVRVGFACESLKTTTRMMQIIAWLLFQRAIHAGEVGCDSVTAKSAQLGEAIPSDPDICRNLPDAARVIIATSEQLYDRVHRLHQNRLRPRVAPPASPVRAMLSQLEHAF